MTEVAVLRKTQLTPTGLWSRLFGSLFVVTLAILLASCQSNPFNYRSGSVPEPGRISLQSRGETSSAWETRDLRLDYRCVRTGNTLKSSGSVAFADHLTYNFSHIDYFYLAVISLDPAGKVLDMQGLAVAGRGGLEPISFSREFTIPSNTSSVAFTYRGVARGPESDDYEYFWTYPVHR